MGVGRSVQRSGRPARCSGAALPGEGGGGSLAPVSGRRFSKVDTE